MTIRVLFVDLDGTLHDYHAAARAAREILVDYIAAHTSHPPAHILVAYEAVLAEQAESVAPSGMELRKQRFAELGRCLETDLAPEVLVSVLGDALLNSINVFPNAVESLHHLAGHFRVIVLTEGYEDIQRAIADKCGVRIPAQDIFVTYAHHVRKRDGSAYEAALRHYDVAPQEAVMIGDNWDWDVAAAARTEIAQIWISHKKPLEKAPPPRFIGIAPEFADAAALLMLREPAAGKPAMPAAVYERALAETDTPPEQVQTIAHMQSAIEACAREIIAGSDFARLYPVKRIMNVGSTSRGTYVGLPVDFDLVIETETPQSEINRKKIKQLSDAITDRIRDCSEFLAYCKAAQLKEVPDILPESIGVRGKESFVARYGLARADRLLPGFHFLDITFGKLPQLTGYELWFRRYLEALPPEYRLRLQREIRLAKIMLRGVEGLWGSETGGFRAHLAEQWIIQSCGYRATSSMTGTLDNALRLIVEKAVSMESGKLQLRCNFDDYKKHFPVWHPGWWEAAADLEYEGAGVNLLDLLGNGDAALAEKQWRSLVALAVSYTALATHTGGIGMKS